MDFILNKFENIKRNSNGSFQVSCPLPCHKHGDKNQSLTITLADDRVLMNCHVCGKEATPEILKAIELEEKDLFKKHWNKENYHSGNGKLHTLEKIKNWPWTKDVYEYRSKENLPYLLSQKKNDGQKGCAYSHVRDGLYQAGMNGKIAVPYRLPELIKGIEQEQIIYLPEGEKDADTLRKHGLIATTNMGGVNGWKACLNKWFKDARVVILYDYDIPGKKFVEAKLKNLSGVTKEIKIVELPGLEIKSDHGEDITDWLEAGHNIEELQELVKNTPPYSLPVVDQKKEDKDFSSDLVLHTDTWNSERLVEQHGGNIRYCHIWKRWIIWTGQRWEKDETGIIQAMAKRTVRSFYKIAESIEDDKKRSEFVKHIKFSEDLRRRKAMIELAQSEDAIPVKTEDLDRDKWLLNCDNGTLNLKTCELWEHRKEDYITKKINVSYNPDATCPTWERFLNRIFNGSQDMIKFVQKAIGYSLTGSTREQCLFILYGTGQNGKSTFITTINNILGDYSQQTPSQTLMIKKNTGSNATNDLAKLKGARFVSSVETEEGGHFAEVLVKQLTGDDIISARFLFQEFFEFRPECKIFIATNHKPAIKNTDFAIWRRIRLIPFTVTIPEEERDDCLLEKLQAEKEGILKWAVDGCRIWLQEGLKPTDEIRRATEAYREEMDTLSDFLKECCVVGERQYKALATDLYNTYVKWCKQNGEDEISQRAFGMKLTERGFVKEKGMAGLFRKKFFYENIAIIQDNKEEDPECPPCPPCPPSFGHVSHGTNYVKEYQKKEGHQGQNSEKSNKINAPDCNSIQEHSEKKQEKSSEITLYINSNNITNETTPNFIVKNEEKIGKNTSKVPFLNENLPQKRCFECKNLSENPAALNLPEEKFYCNHIRVFLPNPSKRPVGFLSQILFFQNINNFLNINCIFFFMKFISSIKINMPPGYR